MGIGSVLNLIPGVHYVYAGIIIAGLIGGYTAWQIHDRHEQRIGAQRIEVAVAAAKAAAEAQNAKDNAARKANDDAQVAREKADYEKRIADSNATVASLNARLRKLAASGNSDQVAVPSNPGSASGTNDASGISGSVELALEGIVTAAGHDADKVAGLQDYITNVCVKPQ